MADIDLRIDDFEDGFLPDLCVSSGLPARTHYLVRAHRQPWWPLAFLLLGPAGLVISLVVVIGTHRSVSGSLPFDDDVQRASASSRRARWSAFILTVILTVAVVLVAGGAGYTNAALIAGLVGTATALASWVAAERPRGAVGLKLSRDGRSVTVHGAAASFAEAYTTQEQARRASRRRLAQRP